MSGFVVAAQCVRRRASPWVGSLEGGRDVRFAFDLDAPIVPGEAAAGCHIGQPIAEVVAAAGASLRREPLRDYRGHLTGEAVYRSDTVDLWATLAGAIWQIGVHGPYRGTLFERVGLGMTIDDIERLVGPCAETTYDTLSIRGIRGLGFDVAWRPDYFIAEDLDFQLPELRFSSLTWYFVFEEDEADPWGGVTIARIPAST